MSINGGVPVLHIDSSSAPALELNDVVTSAREISVCAGSAAEVKAAWSVGLSMSDFGADSRNSRN